MLEVSHVTKRYGKNLACDDVSFTLDDGTVTVLLGPNGAGKSTIMKSMIGFLKYDGTIFVNGEPNKSVNARRMLGYIPELPSLYPNLTVAEHMEFIARAYRLTNYKSHIDDLFERFELTEHRKKFGDELSKGMQQKLNICLGLLPDPQLLLLDEPMIGLDPHAIKELKNLIEEMRAQRKTLLVSTHMIDSVDMLWDRTVIMQHGRVRANVTRTELEENQRSLEDLFFDVTEGLRPEPDLSEDQAPAEAETISAGITSEEVLSHDEIPLEAAPVHDEIPSEAAPIPDGTPSEAAPIPDEIPAAAAPVPDRTPAEAAPIPDEIPSEAAPAPDRTPAVEE